jgi:hypothetical protein
MLAALIFVQLTGTDGGAVWVAPAQVIAVTGIRGRCDNSIVLHEAHAYVETQVHGFCVRETIDQVVDKLTSENRP